MEVKKAGNAKVWANFFSIFAGQKRKKNKEEFSEEKIRKEQVIILFCIFLLIFLFLTLTALHYGNR